MQNRVDRETTLVKDEIFVEAFLGIITEKKHRQGKLQRLQKARTWTFG